MNILIRYILFFITLVLPMASYAQKKPKRDLSKDKSIQIIQEPQKVTKPTPKVTYTPKQKPAPKPCGVDEEDEEEVVYQAPKGKKKKEVKISEIKNYLKLNNSEFLTLNAPAEGTMEKVVVSTDAEMWDVDYNSSWCSIAKYKDYFVLYVKRNDVFSTRSATVYVKANGMQVPININQAARVSNLTAEIVDCKVVHGQKKYINGKTSRYLEISPIVSFSQGKGLACRAEVTFFDDRNQIVQSTTAFPMYAKSLYDKTFTAYSSISLSNNKKQEVKLHFEIPNDALLVAKKNKTLTCNIRIYCNSTGHYLPNASYSTKFKGYKKYGKVRTKSLIKEKVDKSKKETQDPTPSVLLAKTKREREFGVNGVIWKMLLVEHGGFGIGNRTLAKNTEGANAHYVNISKDYYMSETEVTQELWMTIMGTNPSNKIGIHLPVEGVTWSDCLLFIARLNQMAGLKCRLPTEAEWEFAAIGGNKSCYSYFCGSNNLNDVGWTKADKINGPQAVASKQPNELGLYDMTGNVWEWCSDWYEKYSNNSQIDPVGPSSGTFKVCRGGSWRSKEASSYISFRNICYPNERHDYLGLRLCLPAK